MSGARMISTLGAVALVVAACGGADLAGSGTQAPRTTDVATSAPTETEQASDDTTSDSEPGDDRVTETAAPPTDPATTVSPTTVPPTTVPPTTVIPDEAMFAVAPGDEAFCTQMTMLGGFDLSQDDDVAIATMLQPFFDDLLEVAPGDIRSDIELVAASIARVAGGNISLVDAEREPEFVDANERIGVVLDERCEGIEPVDVTDSETGGEPTVVDGVTIPYVTFDSPPASRPTPIFGDPAQAGGPKARRPGFTPDEAAGTFCAVLDEIHRRPQPTDDFEEIEVVQPYLVVLADIAPAEFESAFETVTAYVDALIENGSFKGIDEPDQDAEVGGAIEAIDAFVNERCLGL